MRKLLVVAAIPFATFALACGAGSKSGTTSSTGDAAKPATTPSVATVRAGQPLTLKQSVLGSDTVAVVTVASVKYGVKDPSGFSKPAKGQFISATVSVSVSAGKYTINSSSFKLVASDGTAYDATLALDGHDLSANDLTPGQKASGSVWFDTAKGAQTGGRIALKDALADGDAGYWTL
jgi:hypothetical protein